MLQAATNKTLSLPPGQGIELGLLLLCLGLGRALEVVFVDAVYHHNEGQFELLGLNVRGSGIAILQARIKSLSTKEERPEATSKLCFLMNPSYLRATHWMILPFTKTDIRKKPCLMLMLLSHVRKPVSHPPSQTVWVSALLHSCLFSFSENQCLCLLSADWRHCQRSAQRGHSYRII